MPASEADDPSSWQKAAKIIRDCGIAVLPTDTLYGLCARADEPQAVARIFAAKGRDDDKALLVLVADAEQARELVHMDERGRCVTRRFWPGPLSIVFLARDDARLAPRVQAGLPTLAVRCPAHTRLRELIAGTGPLVAPSANVQGAANVQCVSELDPAIVRAADAIVDGGPARETMPSTLLDITLPQPAILRQGALAREFLQREMSDLAP